MIRRPRVLVIGLDGAEPALVFGHLCDELPHLRHMMGRGLYGAIESTIPCVTIPAWPCMTSGRDPGELGLYSFFDRVRFAYERGPLVSSQAVREPQLWDILSRAGREVVVVGVPPTYPVRPVNGTLVGCFFASGSTDGYAYPAAVVEEITRLVGPYRFDVSNYLTDNKEALLREIYDVTEQHFTVVRHLLTSRAWDFAMFVEVGLDRLQHGFWRYHDPAHPGHVPHVRYASAVRDYYRYLDTQVGSLLELLDDSTVVLVVSDHGAKRMEGAILLNEWLVREGYLVLKRYPEGPTRFFNCEVDWGRTTAWALGGYYGQVFVNSEGRDPQGTVGAACLPGVLDELAARLVEIPSPQGAKITAQVYRPDQIYRRVGNFPPDLMVYFDDLYWRCSAEIGSGALRKTANFPSPDDANHSQYGIFILDDPRSPGGVREMRGLHILDIAPTVLHLLGLPIPADIRGTVRWG